MLIKYLTISIFVSLEMSNVQGRLKLKQYGVNQAVGTILIDGKRKRKYFHINILNAAVTFIENRSVGRNN